MARGAGERGRIAAARRRRPSGGGARRRASRRRIRRRKLRRSAGLFGALAGVLSTAYLTGSSPGSADILLSVVVAAMLGVVFSRRLTPTIGGTLLAVLFIGLLGNGFQLAEHLELLGQRGPRRADPVRRRVDYARKAGKRG